MTLLMPVATVVGAACLVTKVKQIPFTCINRISSTAGGKHFHKGNKQDILNHKDCTRTRTWEEERCGFGFRRGCGRFVALSDEIKIG